MQWSPGGCWWESLIINVVMSIWTCQLRWLESGWSRIGCANETSLDLWQKGGLGYGEFYPWWATVFGTAESCILGLTVKCMRNEKRIVFSDSMYCHVRRSAHHSFVLLAYRLCTVVHPGKLELNTSRQIRPMQDTGRLLSALLWICSNLCCVTTGSNFREISCRVHTFTHYIHGWFSTALSIVGLSCSSPGCAEWTEEENWSSIFGVNYDPYKTLSACQDYCESVPVCVAIDFNFRENSCWIHTSVDDLTDANSYYQEDVNQYRLSRTCSTVTTTSEILWFLPRYSTQRTQRLLFCWLQLMHHTVYSQPVVLRQQRANFYIFTKL